MCYMFTGKESVTLNRSPSMVISIFPPIISVRLFAMESPRPEPSVFLEESPLTNLSVRLPGSMFSSFYDMFLKEIYALPFSSERFRYTLVPGIEYL